MTEQATRFRVHAVCYLRLHRCCHDRLHSQSRVRPRTARASGLPATCLPATCANAAAIVCSLAHTLNERLRTRPVCANVPTRRGFAFTLSFATQCQPTATKRSPNEQHRLPGWCNRHHRRRPVFLRPALTGAEADGRVLGRPLSRGTLWRWSTGAKDPLPGSLFGHDIKGSGPPHGGFASASSLPCGEPAKTKRRLRSSRRGPAAVRVNLAVAP
jgi:hypothetical protein